MRDVMALKDGSAVPPCFLRRAVGAIIGNKVNIQKLRRVILRFYTVNKISYDGLLIPCGYQHGDPVIHLRLVWLGFAQP